MKPTNTDKTNLGYVLFALSKMKRAARALESCATRVKFRLRDDKSQPRTRKAFDLERDALEEILGEICHAFMAVDRVLNPNIYVHDGKE